MLLHTQHLLRHFKDINYNIPSLCIIINPSLRHYCINDEEINQNEYFTTAFWFSVSAIYNEIPKVICLDPPKLIDLQGFGQEFLIIFRSEDIHGGKLLVDLWADARIIRICVIWFLFKQG